jgi:hypothetical protein
MLADYAQPFPNPGKGRVADEPSTGPHKELWGQTHYNL